MTDRCHHCARPTKDPGHGQGDADKRAQAHAPELLSLKPPPVYAGLLTSLQSIYTVSPILALQKYIKKTELKSMRENTE